jgi:hypothetical protein
LPRVSYECQQQKEPEMAEHAQRPSQPEAVRSDPALARRGPGYEALQRPAEAREARHRTLLNARAAGPQPIQRARAPGVVQLRQAHQGANHVNPQFDTGQNAYDRIVLYYGMNARGVTVGIASGAVCDAAGALWAASAPPAGHSRAYLPPQFKDAQRGWQANFQETPTAGGALTCNLHLSMWQ